MNRAHRRAQAPKGREQRDARAFADAVRRHRIGHLDVAERAYLARLRTAPDDPDALHYLGVLRHQQGRSEEAASLIGRALANAPDYVDAWNNLGNVHKASGRLDAAERAYREALGRDDGHAGAWNNLGVVARACGRLPDAIRAFTAAAERAPQMVEAHYNLGGALRAAGKLGESIRAYASALELDPTHAKAHEMLGRVLYVAGDHRAAAEVFRSWRDVEPANPVPRHMLAACSGDDVPTRASDAYVRQIFDAFADSFDEILLERLDYHAPDLMHATLARVLGEPQRTYAVLDAGCGTGLCGVLLAPHARTLVGVDLSPRMLAKARLRDVYDDLVEAELAQFLRAHAAQFDVVASADTLCYFGDLQPAVDAAAIALRPGGWLAFTVERSDEDVDYRINPHGRYSHARDYVSRVLEAASFAAIDVTGGVLRREAGQPVNGWVVRARRLA